VQTIVAGGEKRGKVILKTVRKMAVRVKAPFEFSYTGTGSASDSRRCSHIRKPPRAMKKERKRNLYRPGKK